MDRNTSICLVCKEPIVNFICIDCLAGDIRAWLPGNFSADFARFHENFSRHFRVMRGGFEFCLKCKTFSEKPVCTCCYTSEVFRFLKGLDGKMARSFSNLFPFMKYAGGPRRRESRLPIGEPGREYGICDYCEESSYDIAEVNGEMLCDNCRGEKPLIGNFS